MANIQTRFYTLLNEKKRKMAKQYQDAFQLVYPGIKEEDATGLYDRKEALFAQKHVEEKLAYYKIDCASTFFQYAMAKEDYIGAFDLLVIFDDLEWLENLYIEFGLNIQEKVSITKFVMKHLLAFYVLEHSTFYNLGMASYENAKKLYSGGKPFSSFAFTSIPEDIYDIKEEFAHKVEICDTLKQKLDTSSLDTLFCYSEYLKEFGFSSSFLEELNDFYESKKKKETPVYVTKKVKEQIVPVENLEVKMESYFCHGEPIGFFDEEKMQSFLELAYKLYSPEKVVILKEKIFATNYKINLEKRNQVLQVLFSEEDLCYYQFLYDLDLMNEFYVPYASYIQSTMNIIEHYIQDLMVEYDEVLAICYMDEIHMLFLNMKSCLPYDTRKF